MYCIGKHLKCEQRSIAAFRVCVQGLCLCVSLWFVCRACVIVDEPLHVVTSDFVATKSDVTTCIVFKF